MTRAPNFEHHDPKFIEMVSQHCIRAQMNLEAVGCFFRFAGGQDKACTILNFSAPLQVVGANGQDVHDTILRMGYG